MKTRASKIPARILREENGTILLDCLIAKKKRLRNMDGSPYLGDVLENVFETRRFEKLLFEHLPSLEPGTPIWLKIEVKPGQCIITISEGLDIDIKPFEIEDMLNELLNDIE